MGVLRLLGMVILTLWIVNGSFRFLLELSSRPGVALVSLVQVLVAIFLIRLLWRADQRAKAKKTPPIVE